MLYESRNKFTRSLVPFLRLELEECRYIRDVISVSFSPVVPHNWQGLVTRISYGSLELMSLDIGTQEKKE